MPGIAVEFPVSSTTNQEAPMPPVAQAPTGAAKQIERARQLERERDAITKQIAANRTYLRLMAANDELDDEQQDWLEDFYPTKEKGEQRSKEEIERTRKAKAEARSK